MRQAVKWYRKAAEQGNARGQTWLGSMYKNGFGVPQDDAEAVNWYRKAAEQGDASGQIDLGFMYKKGRGVPWDDAKPRGGTARPPNGSRQGTMQPRPNVKEGRGVPQDDRNP